MAVAQDISDGTGNVVIGEDPCPNGIVNIVIDVGDLVGAADNLTFQGTGYRYSMVSIKYLSR